MSKDAAIIASVGDILRDWTEVKAQRVGSDMWSIAGAYQGTPHSGCTRPEKGRRDPIELARYMDAAAKSAKAAPNAQAPDLPPPDAGGVPDPDVGPAARVESAEDIREAVAKIADDLPASPPVFDPDAFFPTREPPVRQDEVPPELADLVEPDESPQQFHSKLKPLIQRFGIEDGKNFPGGGEALTSKEKILMGRLLAAGARTKQWAGL